MRNSADRLVGPWLRLCDMICKDAGKMSERRVLSGSITIARSLGSTSDAKGYGCGEVGELMGNLFITWMVHVRGLSVSCCI